MGPEAPTPTTPVPTERSIARERAFEQLIAATRMSAPGRQHFEDVALELAADHNEADAAA